MGLDIAFSDHNYSQETLNEFGAVVKALHSVSDHPQECFWASINPPSILSITLNDGMRERAMRILETIEAPRVTVRPSFRKRPPTPDENA
jgi:hypothetical protein